MNTHPPLTRIAQARLAEVLHDGSLAVDATVGNGHDTLFLARQVGPAGRVWGFDIQADALARVQMQLVQCELAERVQLLHMGHEHLHTQLPAAARGRLAAVMFNLGYLPGGDKQLTTLPDTTLQALAGSVANLCPGGLLSVIVYRGHPGGQAEADAVLAWLQAQPADSLSVETIESPGPVLYLARKL
jgi:predicted methyltransferase